MRKLVRRVSVVVLVSLFGAACVEDAGVIRGNGVSKTESRSVDAFHAVHVSDSLVAQITLATEQEQAVAVTGDSNLIAHVRTVVSNGTLTLDVTPNTSFDTNVPLVVTISAQALDALEADSSSTAVASRIAGDDVVIGSVDSSAVSVASVKASKSLRMTARSSATIEADGVEPGGPLTVNEDSSGEIELRGLATSLDATVSASSSLHADLLAAATVVLDATSSSTASVCASQSLDATVTGSSTAVYSCNPGDVKSNVDPSSSLTEE